MINRIHFNAFGGGLYPGGLIIGCVFLFTRGRAYNWATTFPRSSPTRPREAERVSFPRP